MNIFSIGGNEPKQPASTGATYRVNSDGRTKKQPIIIASGVENRTRVFLKLFGQDYTTWKRIADKYGIKVEVGVAIAFADTHLGYATKGTNNIGNVGSFDRGGTIHYKTIEEGISAMFYTLNNKYLKNKVTIGDLSFAGDCIIDCTKVYATSTENRNNNVLNTLSNIYKRQITSDFKFRLEK